MPALRCAAVRFVKSRLRTHLYQLIRQPPPVTDRRFEIEFQDSGVAGYAFTFG
jgi:hypothetical protein